MCGGDQLAECPPFAKTARRCSPLLFSAIVQNLPDQSRKSASVTRSKQARARKMIRELRSLGYRFERLTSQPANPA